MAEDSIYREYMYGEVGTFYYELSATLYLFLPYASLIALCFFAFVAAGIVKGVTGLGLPITAVSLLTLFADIKVAIVFVILPIIFTNIAQLASRSSSLAMLSRYWRLIASMCVMTLFITGFVQDIPHSTLNIFMGCSVLLFIGAKMFHGLPKIPDRYDKHCQYATGIATGFVGGSTGLVVVPLAIYFSTFRFTRDEFITVSCPIFLIGGLILLLGFSSAGLFTVQYFYLSLFMVLPSLLGIVIGEALASYISELWFRRIILSVLLVLAVKMLFSGVFHLS